MTGGLASPPDTRNNSPTFPSGSSSALPFSNFLATHSIDDRRLNALLEPSSHSVEPRCQDPDVSAEKEIRSSVPPEADDQMDGLSSKKVVSAPPEADDKMDGLPHGQDQDDFAEKEIRSSAPPEADDQMDGLSSEKVVLGSMEDEDVSMAEVDKNISPPSEPEIGSSALGVADGEMEGLSSKNVESKKVVSVSSGPLEDRDVCMAEVEKKNLSSDSAGDEEGTDTVEVKKKNPSSDLLESEDDAEYEDDAGEADVESKKAASDSSSDSSEEEEEEGSETTDPLEKQLADKLNVLKMTNQTSMDFDEPFEPRRSSRNAVARNKQSPQLVPPPTKSTRKRKVTTKKNPISMQASF